jgi:diguanylate cyclase (GGDEF)-like protein
MLHRRSFTPAPLTRAATDLVVCRGVDERARVLDINRRLMPYSRWGIALILIAGLAGVPAYGWAPLAGMIAGGLVFETVERRLADLERPEVRLVALLLIAQLCIATGIALAHGPSIYLISVLSFPLMFAAAILPSRTVRLVTVLSVLLLIGLAFVVATATVLSLPPLVVGPAIFLVTLPLLMETACDLDAESRSSVVIDRLTGLLNRAALPPRLAELEHCARTTGQPVALVIGDVDRFKRVNDEHGHATGDMALKEIAYCLRKSLGPFQPVYRIGGEEFLILLPDTDAARAALVAEQLRQAIATTPVSQLALTMSFGVSDSAPEQAFDFDAAFARADAALYEAKNGGRNRAVIARQTTAVTGPVQVGEATAPSAPEGLSAEAWAGNEGAAAPTLERGAAPPATSATQTGHGPTGQEPAALEQAGESEDSSERSWLIPDAVSRAHLLDLTQRLTKRAAGSYALGFATVLAAAPYYGWWILLPGFVTGMIFNVIIANLERFRRPEYALGLGGLLAQTGAACGFLVAHGEILWDLPVLVLLLVGFSVLLPIRGVLVGVLFTAATMVAVALIHSPEAVAGNPSLLVLPVALAASVGLVGSGVGRSDLEHRGLAIIDPLTGMLNRAALEAKIVAVTHEANLTGQPVALAVADLDHFKVINDTHGHVVGDAVLATVASRIRSSLRAFDSAYRVGGEEFVVLLPGVDAAAAAAVAERIRAVVCELPIEEVPVTISLGVAASEPGRSFDYQAVFEAADAALYRAKADGRNRVHCPGAKPVSALAAHPVAA